MYKQLDMYRFNLIFDRNVSFLLYNDKIFYFYSYIDIDRDKTIERFIAYNFGEFVLGSDILPKSINIENYHTVALPKDKNIVLYYILKGLK